MKAITHGDKTLILRRDAADYLETSIQHLDELGDSEILTEYYKQTPRGTIQIAYDLDELYALEKGSKKVYVSEKEGR